MSTLSVCGFIECIHNNKFQPEGSSSAPQDVANTAETTKGYWSDSGEYDFYDYNQAKTKKAQDWNYPNGRKVAIDVHTGDELGASTNSYANSSSQQPQ